MGKPLSSLELKQVQTPVGNPPTGAVLLYFKDDGKVYAKNSAGVERSVEAEVAAAATQAEAEAGSSTTTKAWSPQRVKQAIDYNTKVFAVEAATTVNILLSGTKVLDGVSLAVGQSVLVKNQSTESQNGVYIVQSGAWTRHPAYNTSADVAGSAIRVKGGATQYGLWTTYFSINETLNTHPMLWSRLMDQDYSDVLYEKRGESMRGLVTLTHGAGAGLQNGLARLAHGRGSAPTFMQVTSQNSLRTVTPSSNTDATYLYFFARTISDGLLYSGDNPIFYEARWD